MPTRLSALALGGLGVIMALTAFAGASQPTFLPDDPIAVEHDTEDASGMPAFETSLFVDFVYNIVTGRPPVAPGRARNVNTIDEVPDSSW